MTLHSFHLLFCGICKCTIQYHYLQLFSEKSFFNIVSFLIYVSFKLLKWTNSILEASFQYS